MMIKLVLFDLDGTLLPMDQDKFLRAYFGGLAKKLAPHGYDPEKLIGAIWAGTAAMVKNDGTQTNEAVFWEKFCAYFGPEARSDEPVFTDFYEKEFQQVRAVCGYDPAAAETVRLLKARGLRVALATNPLFPAIATHSRIRWAGLQPEDFELVTTYENSCFCKPNLRYYEEICRRLGVSPGECLMVGNDVSEDMVTREIGMRVYLLTECLINKSGTDISAYPNGDLPGLISCIEALQNEC